MFRINRWTEPQTYKPNPFDTGGAKPLQDIKQVWFSGVHADIGGGYPETESAPAKYPLRWLIDEAVLDWASDQCLPMYNHLVLGHADQGETRSYTAPSVTTKLHDFDEPGLAVSSKVSPSGSSGATGRNASVLCSVGICRCASRAASMTALASITRFLNASIWTPPIDQ